MNIVVILRLAPFAGEELELDPSGRDIDREILGTSINEFDDQALEEAILIKRASGASVTALALRVEGIEQALRVAFARGADRSVIVDGPELDPYDTRGAAATMAAAIRDPDADLVLTGVQTPYDVFGQTAPYVASALGWPYVSVVTQVQPADGVVRVTQEYAGGRRALLESWALLTIAAPLDMPDHPAPPPALMASARPEVGLTRVPTRCHTARAFREHGFDVAEDPVLEKTGERWTT